MLISSFTRNQMEAGCDEAGRGCLAGPVFAAAVILPVDFHHPLLNDSKKMTASAREIVRSLIEQSALAWAVAQIDHLVIDEINILNASILAMHKAIEKLNPKPELLLIDGNRFKPFPGIRHQTFVKGDSHFTAIAAASVLAKTHRDEFMNNLHNQYPQYDWKTNKGYATGKHIQALQEFGPSPFHRKSFHLKSQLSLPF